MSEHKINQDTELTQAQKADAWDFMYDLLGRLVENKDSRWNRIQPIGKPMLAMMDSCRDMAKSPIAELLKRVRTRHG